MFGNYFGGFGGGMMPSFRMGSGFFGNMYQQPQMMSMGYQPFMGNPYAQQRQMMQQQPQFSQMMYSPFGGGPMNYSGGFGRPIQSPQEIGEQKQQVDPMQQRFAEMQKQLAATKERVLPQTYTPPQPPTSSRGMGRPLPSANFQMPAMPAMGFLSQRFGAF
tara:strand:+ start:74 stop:556 length:483 start_codon:yes stop_codon:yes gene_type:complete